MSDVTQETLKKETEKAYTRSMGAFIELSHDENFVNVMEKYNVTLVELSSTMISQVFSSSGMDLKLEKGIFEAIDSCIETICEKAEVHPSDAVLLLAKITSDMMMQIAALIKLEDKND